MFSYCGPNYILHVGSMKVCGLKHDVGNVFHIGNIQDVEFLVFVWLKVETTELGQLDGLFLGDVLAFQF